MVFIFKGFSVLVWIIKCFVRRAWVCNCHTHNHSLQSHVSQRQFTLKFHHSLARGFYSWNKHWGLMFATQLKPWEMSNTWIKSRWYFQLSPPITLQNNEWRSKWKKRVTEKLSCRENRAQWSETLCLKKKRYRVFLFFGLYFFNYQLWIINTNIITGTIYQVPQALCDAPVKVLQHLIL